MPTTAVFEPSPLLTSCLIAIESTPSLTVGRIACPSSFSGAIKTREKSSRLKSSSSYEEMCHSLSSARKRYASLCSGLVFSVHDWEEVENQRKSMGYLILPLLSDMIIFALWRFENWTGISSKSDIDIAKLLVIFEGKVARSWAIPIPDRSKQFHVWHRKGMNCVCHSQTSRPVQGC